MILQTHEKVISKMVRALADRHADLCGVDRDDNWKIYGEGYISEVKAILTAIGVDGKANLGEEND